MRAFCGCGAYGSGGSLLDPVVVGLIALFSSDDHISFPGRVLPLPQQWGVWLIAVYLPLVLADAQLAARSRVARLDALRARLDRGRLAFQLDPSAGNRRQLQRLLNLLNSPEMADIFRG